MPYSITIFLSILPLLFLGGYISKIRFKNIPDLFLWFGIGALLFTVSEILIGRLIFEVFEYTLWEYRFESRVDGFSHKYAWLLWGCYGIYAYFISRKFSNSGKNLKKSFPFWVSIEALLLEIYANIIFLLVYKDFLFYYFPGEIWHLSTIFVLPFYYLAYINY